MFEPFPPAPRAGCWHFPEERHFWRLSSWYLWMPVFVFSHAAGTKGNREALYTKAVVLSSVYLWPRSQSYYLRNCKMWWSRLMLRLGPGYLPSGEKRTPNRSELVIVFCDSCDQARGNQLVLKTPWHGERHNSPSRARITNQPALDNPGNMRQR